MIKLVTTIIGFVIGKWRIIAFVSIFAGGLYGAHFIKVRGLERTIKDQEQKIAFINSDLQAAKVSNNNFKLTVNDLQRANKDCVLNNQANERKTKRVIEALENSRNVIDEKYNQLKNKKVISICGNAIIDPAVIELMQ